MRRVELNNGVAFVYDGTLDSIESEYTTVKLDAIDRLGIDVIDPKIATELRKWGINDFRKIQNFSDLENYVLAIRKARSTNSDQDGLTAYQYAQHIGADFSQLGIHFDIYAQIGNYKIRSHDNDFLDAGDTILKGGIALIGEERDNAVHDILYRIGADYTTSYVDLPAASRFDAACRSIEKDLKNNRIFDIDYELSLVRDKALKEGLLNDSNKARLEGYRKEWVSNSLLEVNGTIPEDLRQIHHRLIIVIKLMIMRGVQLSPSDQDLLNKTHAALSLKGLVMSLALYKNRLAESDYRSRNTLDFFYSEAKSGDNSTLAETLYNLKFWWG